MERYTVEKDDTLPIVAMKVYGDSSLWRRIYDANRSTVQDPNTILPGQRLDIPSQMDGIKQRSMMTPDEQLRQPEEGLSYPIEFEALELLIGATALLKGLLKAGVKLFTPKASKAIVKQVDDVFKQVVDPITGKTKWPNSPYANEFEDPRKLMKEINDEVEKSLKEARGKNSLGKENAEIQRIHKEFIETGKWPIKDKKLGDCTVSMPQLCLRNAREEYLKALREHGG